MASSELTSVVAAGSSPHLNPNYPYECMHRHDPTNVTWLLRELLKRTDVANGDICMFHYPMPSKLVPFTTVEDMQRAIDTLSLGTTAAQQDHNDDNAGDNNVGHNNNGIIPPEYMERSTPESRSRITRIQFCWYQFEELPMRSLMNAFVNLQHIDIRQNASLTSIDSIITQLPNLTSLNLSDCPNVRTLSPLATAVLFDNHDASSNNDNNNGVNDDNLDLSVIRRRRRRLALRHLWVRGCNLLNMSNEEWSQVFTALAESTGPLERLTLSRNKMRFLHGDIGKLKSLTYLFIEDNNAPVDSVAGVDGRGSSGFVLPEEIGLLQSLRFASFCGNNITRLPKQMAQLNINCDVYVHRNPNLRYPPPPYQRSIKLMRQYFHEERMRLLRGTILFMPHVTRSRWRALERLYKPGGSGYFECKGRFEESVRRTSITIDCDM